ncbi:MAG: hypothetical protein Q4F43_04135 [Eubacteriales bacterium]|nr:hypothetical protein [Eubacteriales bacterium]
MFQDIEFLQTAYRTCFGIAIAALVLAVALFFLLDIKEIILIETGHAQRRTVERMHAKNQRTGKLRDDTEADLGTTGARTVKSTTEAKTASELSDSPGGAGADGRQQPVPLSTGFTAPENSRKRQGMLESQEAQTAVGARQDRIGDDNGRETEVLDNSGRTVPDFMFRVTKKITITHTDESISA